MNGKLLKVIIKNINKPLFILGTVLSVFGTSMSLLIPQYIGELLDIDVLSKTISNSYILLGMILFFITVYVVQAGSSILLGFCGGKAVNSLQRDIYSHILKSKVKDLDNYSSGDLASRLTNDMSIVLNFVTVTIPNFLLNILVILGSLFFLLQISFSMTLLSILIVPMFLLIVIPINNRIESHYTDYQEHQGLISSNISHKMVHLRLIKTFRGEKKEEENMGDSFDRLFLNFKKIVCLSSLQNVLVSSMMMAIIILLLVVAGVSVSQGTITISLLTTFILYMFQLIDPITDMSNVATEFSEFSSVTNRLMDLMELEVESNQMELEYPSNGSISFENVDFSYADEKVLKSLTINIPEGSHIAIIGPSGSGKTTIFNLLMKFYDNYKGIIKIGDLNIRDLSSKQLRNVISYIPQNNSMFQGSIRENLLYGKNKYVSERRLHEVLENLKLNQVVNGLPEGLETNISDSGAGISEGQKQRFNIARGLMLEHSVYLMDEITASLDSETERVIANAIDKMTLGKTRLTIAHRLHTIRNADYVLVLNKDGSISDFGEHEEIFNRNNLYNDYISKMQDVG